MILAHEQITPWQLLLSRQSLILLRQRRKCLKVSLKKWLHATLWKLNNIPVCGKKAALSDRNTFSTYLDKCNADMEMELKRTFESLEYISTTADIWTSHNKSFLGMTAHWIDSSTLVGGHAALAFEGDAHVM